MARLNLKKMSVGELIDLRERIQGELSRKIGQERGALQKKIEELKILESGTPRTLNRTGSVAKPRRIDRRSAAETPKTAPKKVAPKYRSPDGETWSGRGLAPRWLKSLEADGKKRESYLIRK